MSFFTEYEERAFIYLGLALMWIMYWAVGIWAIGKWFGLPVVGGFLALLGVLMFVGFVDLMLFAVVNLVIGQWKLLLPAFKKVKG